MGQEGKELWERRKRKLYPVKHRSDEIFRDNFLNCKDNHNLSSKSVDTPLCISVWFNYTENE